MEVNCFGQGFVIIILKKLWTFQWTNMDENNPCFATNDKTMPTDPQHLLSDAQAKTSNKQFSVVSI